MPPYDQLPRDHIYYRFFSTLHKDAAAMRRHLYSKLSSLRTDQHDDEVKIIADNIAWLIIARHRIVREDQLDRISVHAMGPGDILILIHPHEETTESASNTGPREVVSMSAAEDEDTDRLKALSWKVKMLVDEALVEFYG